MTQFVTMYHPALGDVRVQAPLQAVPSYEAHGWVLVDGSAPVPSPIDLTPALGDLRYLKLGDVSTPGTLTGDRLRAAFGSLNPAVTGITRDGSGRVTGFTEGSTVYTAITRNTGGYVTSYTADGTVHAVTRDGSNLITGVS